MKHRNLCGVALLLPIIIVSCKRDVQEVPKKDINISSNSTLGNILTDKEGRTLYFFSNDVNGQNSCTGGCESLWPVFNIDNFSASSISADLSFSDFATVTNAGGKTQLTYKGWPLYYYAPLVNGINAIEAPGQTNGEAFNGVWFVAKPDYSIMISNTQLVGADGQDYINDSTLGSGKTKYFTDLTGRTLYIFIKDSANINKYTKPDFSNNATWPIYETDNVTIPSNLEKTLFSSITVAGKKQLTYKGWPLYFFSGDAGARGSTKGISVPKKGIWPVASKDMAAAPLP